MPSFPSAGNSLDGWTANVETELDAKVDVAGDTITGLLTIGSGDPQYLYTASADKDGRLLRLHAGTTASPDTTLGPLVKASRRVSVLASAFAPSDGGEQMAAITGISAGDAANQVQPVGVYAAATNAGTTSAGTGPMPDAVGIYGIARIYDGGVGSGIGGVLYGRRESDTGRATGAEIAVFNYGTTNLYNSASGYQRTQGIWLTPAGSADSAVGMTIGNSHGYQFDVGIVFDGTTVGGKVGSVKSAAIRDNSSATTSYLLNGTHDYGIDMAGGTFATAGIRAKGHVHFADDNTWDIGASASANRPRDVYVGRDLRVGSTSAIVLRVGTGGGVITQQRVTSAFSAAASSYYHTYVRDGSLTNTYRLMMRAEGDEVTLIDNIPRTTIANGGESPSMAMTPGSGAMVLRDDFITGSLSSATAGELGWTLGNGATSSQPAIANHPGIMRRGTGTTADTNAYTRLWASGHPAFRTDAPWEMLWIMRPLNVDANTQIRVGMEPGGFFNTAPNYGAWLEKLATDTNWHLVTANNAGHNRYDTGIAAVAGDWIKLRMRYIASGTVAFSLNGAAEVQRTGAPTSTASTPGFAIVNVGAAADKNIDVDLFELSQTGLIR